MRLSKWYKQKCGWIPRPVRRTIVLVIGGTLLLLGVMGMALPIMPGFIFIPLALAILAVEFAWAARWLHKVRHAAKGVSHRIKNGLNGARNGATGRASRRLTAPLPLCRGFLRRWFSPAARE